MSLGVVAQVWLCRVSGYLGLLLLLCSQSMAVARRLGWISAKNHILWRRRLGINAACLSSLHVFIVWRTLLAGYILAPFRETPWIMWGLGAWLVLLLLWFTSYPRVVRLLRVTHWRQLHRLAYPATLMAVLHVLLAPWSNPRIHLGFLILFGGMIGLRILPFQPILKR